MTVKTSINVDEWLIDRVRATVPDVPFGTLCRDALLIALPQWEREGRGGALRQALEVQTRALRARADQAGVHLDLPKPANPVRARPVAPPTPPPADPRARPRGPGGKFATTAAGPSTPPKSRQRKPAPFPPKPKPTAGSNGTASASRAAAAGTRRAG